MQDGVIRPSIIAPKALFTCPATTNDWISLALAACCFVSVNAVQLVFRAAFFCISCADSNGPVPYSYNQRRHHFADYPLPEVEERGSRSISNNQLTSGKLVEAVLGHIHMMNTTSDSLHTCGGPWLNKRSVA